MAVFRIGIIQFDDLSPTFSTTNTTGSGIPNQSFTVDGNASPITLFIDDDDSDFDDGFIDPPGNSTNNNNQLVAEPVTINGTEYGPAASGGTPEDQVELEFAFTTDDGQVFYVVRVNGVNVGLTGPTLPQAGQSFTVDSASDGEDEPYANLACFVSGTPIDTPSGARAVEEIRPGDPVLTYDSGPMAVREVAQRTLSVAELLAHPHLRPIRFEAGAIGNARPLHVSPQHRVLLRGPRAELLFGESEVLAAATSLVDGRQVTRAALTGSVTYHHLIFEAHQLVLSDGAVSESLDPNGAAAQDPAVTEFHALFCPIPRPDPGLVRPSLTCREARMLMRG